jgi:hypothetical protein
MKKFFAVFISLLIFTGLAAADLGQTYSFNGETLKPISLNRPHPTCDRWEIWLYTSRGALRRPFPLPGQPGYLGTIWGRTPSDIQNQVERFQKFQRAYEKVTGLTQHDDLWDHALGPICVFPTRYRPGPVVLRGLRQADNNQIQFTRMWINLGDVFMHSRPIPSAERPQFRDAFDKLSKAFYRNSKLHNLLTSTDPPSETEIRDAIYEATDAIQRAQLSASNIHALLVGTSKNPRGSAHSSNPE